MLRRMADFSLDFRDPPSSLPYSIRKALRSRAQLLSPCDELHAHMIRGLEVEKHARIFLPC